MDWLVRHDTEVKSLHMTLVDVHPASLARVVVILSLLQQILDLNRQNRDESTKKEVELYATIFFVYTSMVMPDYCCEMWVFIDELQCTLVLNSLLVRPQSYSDRKDLGSTTTPSYTRTITLCTFGS